MELVLLGTGGYHPNERRHTASIMVPEWGLIFDAGTSAFRIQSRIVTSELDIFLSHAHLDHIVGLTFLIVPVLTKQVERIRVHGNAATLSAVQNHLFADPLFPVDAPFEFVELIDGKAVTLPNGIPVYHHELVSHPGKSRAYRVDWQDVNEGDHSFAYVTDTVVDESYLDFIEDVDVLIHECYFADEMQDWADQTGHSYASAVANLVAEVGVGKLVLTHIDPQNATDDPVDLEKMKTIFPNIVLAEDLMTLEFPSPAL